VAEVARQLRAVVARAQAAARPQVEEVGVFPIGQRVQGQEPRDELGDWEQGIAGLIEGGRGAVADKRSDPGEHPPGGDDSVAASWNEPDEAKRTALMEESWADNGVYQDPTGTADGRAALVAHIGGVHAMFPDRSIDFASGIEATEAGVRWAWVMRNGDAVELEGMDFGELAPDGRIQRIAGFSRATPTARSLSHAAPDRPLRTCRRLSIRSQLQSGALLR
jgi:hypothetical protein